MKNRLKKEPVLTLNAVIAAVASLIVLLQAFGVPITEAQVVALLGIVATVGPILAALFARDRVTPVDASHDPNQRAGR